MKYVVLKMTVRGMSREVPVIFPDLISHVNMAASALVALDAECEGFKKTGDRLTSQWCRQASCLPWISTLNAMGSLIH